MAVALVTGAARGIGAATVEVLVAQGWAVVASDSCADDPALDYPLASRAELDAVADRHPGHVIAAADVIKPLFEASKGAIPIVGGCSDSPMRAEIAVSLSRPGKNFTGITFLTDEMAAKRMEFLKEAAPTAKRVAVIFNPQHFDDEVTFARRGA